MLRTFEDVGDRAGDVLFLTNLGEAFTADRLSKLVADYVDAANVGKRGACHLFRHTMATLMHENGADIRFIQVMLGHAKLETTTLYTHVAIKKLKEIHTATHPAKLQRPASNGTPADPGADSKEPTTDGNDGAGAAKDTQS